jgi:hypothetical protein
MKKNHTLVLVLLTMAVTFARQNSYAQTINWDAVPVAVPSDSFPIAPFVGWAGFVSDPNYLKLMGFNSAYSASAGEVATTAANMTLGMKAWPYCNWTWNPGTPNARDEGLDDYFGNTICGNAWEHRYFLASNEALYTQPKGNPEATEYAQFISNPDNVKSSINANFDLDRVTNWNAQPPGISQNVGGSGEYLIPKDVQDNVSTNYVLEQFGPHVATNDQNLWDRFWSFDQIEHGSNPPIIDFIFRIDPKDIPGSALGTDELYEVEYDAVTITYNGSAYVTSFTPLESDPITKNVIKNFTPIQNEAANILWFPKNDPGISSTSGYTPHPYIILRASHLSQFTSSQSSNWNTNSPVTGMWIKNWLDIRLHRIGTGAEAVPIYVRGVRIRSQFADGKTNYATRIH